MPIKRGFARVAFDELAWHEDLRQAPGSAKRIGEETRSRLEREGQVIDALFACDEEARDGTSLPGVRHLPAGSRGETVYQLAHRRLNS
ncbi:MAG TPA: hypothetical protein VFX35_11235 [Solirubrobacterales bacterium]|nr:hypothetical protein [Solirubrobacterales bacterium]